MAVVDSFVRRCGGKNSEASFVQGIVLYQTLHRAQASP